MAERWYVVRTEPAREKTARTFLDRAGFESWLPECRVHRVHRRFVEHYRAPLFPGYVFARFDVGARQWGAINDLIGVIGLLCEAGRPAPVREADVAALTRLAGENGGVVDIQVSRFRPGDAVHPLSGPFSGYLAHVVAVESGEVALTLDIFQRPVAITLSEAQVEPA